MKTLSTTLCPGRHVSGSRAAEIAPRIQAMLVSTGGERSWQRFLNQNPEPIGWRFSLGISPVALVRPQFRSGSDFVADFLVVDTPQWTQVTLVEIESPTAIAFKEDGQHGPKLVEAISQTSRWKNWLRNNLPTFQHEVIKAIQEVPSFGAFEALYQRRVLPCIATGTFHVMSAIVIGRRNALHPNEYNQHVVDFLRDMDKNMIFSFDALVDTCIERTE